MQLLVSDVPADGDRRIRRVPSSYRARAWWGDELIADSAETVRVEETDRSPTLYFPVASVRFDRLDDRGGTAICPVKGTARLWEIDGHEILWRFVEPASDLGWLTEYAAFDHDRVRVEVIDGLPGDADRDVTIKKFPTWGDAAHLVDVLDVHQVGESQYESVARSSWRRPVVEGSQMLGQSIVACSREVPGRRVVSAHMVFFRAADARVPLVFGLESLSTGRMFSTFTVHVEQRGRRCASGTFLLDEGAPDVIRHEEPPPETAGPYEAEPFDMAVTGRDLRVVDGAYTGDSEEPAGPPVLDAWIRFRTVPADQALHAALLAQFTGHFSIAAALRSHEGIGQDQAHRTLSTAINAIAISFHRDVRADRWMLYRHLSTVAGDGMTHSECRVHDEDGHLVASFAVDAMVRGFRSGTGAVDDRTAM